MLHFCSSHLEQTSHHTFELRILVVKNSHASWRLIRFAYELIGGTSENICFTKVNKWTYWSRDWSQRFCATQTNCPQWHSILGSHTPQSRMLPLNHCDLHVQHDILTSSNTQGSWCGGGGKPTMALAVLQVLHTVVDGIWCNALTTITTTRWPCQQQCNTTARALKQTDSRWL